MRLPRLKNRNWIPWIPVFGLLFMIHESKKQAGLRDLNLHINSRRLDFCEIYHGFMFFVIFIITTSLIISGYSSMA